MYLNVFRSRKRADYDAAAYTADAARMIELAQAQPGFLAVKSYAAPDGETVTISEWESEAHAQGWGRHPEHALVQGRGRLEYYESYTMFTCAEPRVQRFGG
ncbi:antibiotic biosynthesis monooxygenase family protein [Novosphingobium sp. 9]|uniref:antibiotic biosynthesis monooxygenase family protein n=1 Tax=Novosphingobium sp. 9 TaxID=2025349 RepID=UPI0021B5E3F0|nr:antibiotic biosynthesis monooxygenase [Novosphingobium sp. 9]